MDYKVLTPGLYLLKETQNYIEWIYDIISPYLGKRILEVGSGMGYYGKFFRNFELYCATDVHKDYLNALKEYFSGFSNVLVFKYDIVEDNTQKLLPLAIDTVVCIEVLEHIRDDTVALKNIYKILVPEGRLILFCPAFPFLYGSNDRSIGHQRRYTKNELLAKLKDSNFYVERVLFHNMVGILGWFLNGKVLRREVATLLQLKTFNAIVPFLKVLEACIPPFIGLNIIGIAKKM